MSLDSAVLLYHAEVREYLQREEAPVWEWFASNRVQKEHAEAVRFDLLKRMYRIGRDSQPDLYRVADAAAASLGVGHEITLYQAQHAEGLNASLAYLPDEAHIILAGPVSTKLNERELQALFGHELGHVLMYEVDDGELLVASQVLAAMTNDRSADTPHFETMRLFDLYQEVYCDRMAARAVDGDTDTVVSMLVKVATGLDTVEPAVVARIAPQLRRHAVPLAAVPHAEHDRVEDLPEIDPRPTGKLGRIRFNQDRLDNRPQRIVHFPDRLQRRRNGHLAPPGLGLREPLRTSPYAAKTSSGIVTKYFRND
ncbi:hypothetical protein Pla108_38410 [Botrimarina colliarenosi]|uniref:Peptidase M48 domain-containing protein n=1 Tax=Botrimarina colliarenosi TaxID=2528001 RepID=A0A5C6A3S0_9BACT|nr:M48 family metalloprotease [Botrimarina colliarenosi]TWT94129.1 hypothetical protein Pla108_38410 [Botrimarina colliarenosi]